MLVGTGKGVVWGAISKTIMGDGVDMNGTPSQTPLQGSMQSSCLLKPLS